MDLTGTDEHRSLADTARRFLAERTDDRPAAWADLVALGWLDPGLDGLSRALLAEETGYALCRLPWLSTVGLAGPVLRAAGVSRTGPVTLAWLDAAARSLPDSGRAVACSARADGTTWRLTGTKHAVPDADGATAVSVVAATPDGPALFLVDLDRHPDVRHPLSTMDTTRPLAELRLDGTPAEPLRPPGAATTDALASAWRMALTLTAAEAVGVARRVLELAVTHAGVRTQFGRPIGAFQAVAHRLADIFAGTELARSAVLRAVHSSQDPQSDRDEAVRTAAVAAKRAAMAAAEGALQVFGGTGFAWEHPLHLWYRRAQWLHAFEGTPRQLRAGIAAHLLGP
jgi:acyl-CoA dehydrogenase